MASLSGILSSSLIRFSFDEMYGSDNSYAAENMWIIMNIRCLDVFVLAETKKKKQKTEKDHTKLVS